MEGGSAGSFIVSTSPARIFQVIRLGLDRAMLVHGIIEWYFLRCVIWMGSHLVLGF
jgi:hypothetical protein